MPIYYHATGAAAEFDASIEPESLLQTFQFLRQNEDWSSLSKIPPSLRNRAGGNFKYIPLNRTGSVWASFGGHLRGRLESWDNFGFGTPVEDDDEYGLGRVLLHGDFNFDNRFRIFVEAKSAFATDRNLPGGKRSLDVDEVDIQQAFADFYFDLDGDSEFTLRLGRQALLFGNQRLVSPLPWGNSLRSWDGVTARLNTGRWKIDGFWTQFAPVKKHKLNHADSAIEFAGLYASTGLLENANVDVYGFGLHKDSGSFNGSQEQEDRYTLGARIFGRLSDSNIDYDAEVAYQFGEFGSNDISAFMVSTQIGYTFNAAKLQPRFTLGLDYASGDDRDDGLDTFNQLFPLGHAFLGFIDIIGRQNIVDVSTGVRLTPSPGITFNLNVHAFRRASKNDALYNAGGGVVRAGNLDDARTVGTELDFSLRVSINRSTNILFGYSQFVSGEFIENSGAEDDIGFTYIQTQFTF